MPTFGMSQSTGSQLRKARQSGRTMLSRLSARGRHSRYYLSILHLSYRNTVGISKKKKKKKNYFYILEGTTTPVVLSTSLISAAGTRSNIQRTSSSMSIGRMNKSRNNRPMSSSSSLIKSSTHQGSLSNLTLCLPRDYDVIVYRAQGGGSTSEFIQV